jgi:hypothetical protein
MSQIGESLNSILDNYIHPSYFENNSQLRVLEHPMQRKLAFIYGILNLAEEGLLGGNMEKLDSFLNTLNQYANQPDGDLKVANLILSIIRNELTDVLHDTSQFGEEITRNNISDFYEYIKGGPGELFLSMSVLHFGQRSQERTHDSLSRDHVEIISSQIEDLRNHVGMLEENLTRDLYEPTEFSYYGGEMMLTKIEKEREILNLQKGPFSGLLMNPNISPEEKAFYQSQIAHFDSLIQKIDENIRVRRAEIEEIYNIISSLEGEIAFFGRGGGYKVRNKSKKNHHNKKHKTRNNKYKNKSKSKSKKY